MCNCEALIFILRHLLLAQFGSAAAMLGVFSFRARFVMGCVVSCSVAAGALFIPSQLPGGCGV